MFQIPIFGQAIDKIFGQLPQLTSASLKETGPVRLWPCLYDCLDDLKQNQRRRGEGVERLICYMILFFCNMFIWCLYPSPSPFPLPSWCCLCPNHMHSESVECPEYTFKCPASYCIPLRFRCNGVWDCSFGEDEEDCGKSCSTWIESNIIDHVTNMLRICHQISTNYIAVVL